MSMSIIVLRPTNPLSRAPNADLFSHARFAEELRANGATVDVREDAPSSDDGKGFLLVFSSEPPSWVLSLPDELRLATLERVVLLHCYRAPAMLDNLEEWEVAAGIEDLTYQLWESPTNGGTGYGIAGRREAVAAISGKMASAVFTSEHYCIYGSSTSHSLSQALVEYLAALGGIRSGEFA